MRIIKKIQTDMPAFFSDFRIELLQEVFQATDVDNSGTLDLNEITPLIK
jgi:Ca2+-binding EF-hand superfamily protein